MHTLLSVIKLTSQTFYNEVALSKVVPIKIGKHTSAVLVFQVYVIFKR